MLRSLTFTRDYRCFKAGDKLAFRPGACLLVGDQGTGKSTVLSAIREYAASQDKERCPIRVDASPIKMMSLDFEKDTPRGKSQFDETKSYLMQAATLFMSHGQVSNLLLAALSDIEDTLVLMDEPDMALSIRAAKKLAGTIASAVSRRCQVVASVHNQTVIEAFPEVLSLEHRRWMGSKEFVNSMLSPMTVGATSAESGDAR